MKKKLNSLITAVFVCSSIFGQVNKPINEDEIKCAEKLFDLDFTVTERDSMIEGLEAQLKNFLVLHSINIDNSIPPALIFNPIPAGFDFKNVKEGVSYSDYSEMKMPSDKNDLAFYSVGQLSELIKTKQISSVELTKFFIERLNKYDPQLHCVISLTEKRAMNQAKKMDAELAAGNYRGILHGIPFGVKDLLATKDYKTTWGAMPYKDQKTDVDATVITKLEEAGGVMVAKLSMGALAMDDTWFGGLTRNPWNTETGSSGSSAGSASAVSAGLVPFAIGTETWGSIVSPSTVCGVTGLRPTYGRVSRYGAMALSWSMDKIGTICHDVEDCAIVFNAIYGCDGKDQTVYNLPFGYKPEVDLSKLKIGYLKKDFDKNYDFHDYDSIALAKLRELGADLIETELPGVPVNDIAFILTAESAAAFDELTRSNRDDLLVRQTKNDWANIFRMSRFVPAVEYINANRLRYELIQKMDSLMQTVDLYIAPSFEGDNLLLTNLTGNPSVVIPTGFDKKGMPVSITINGRLFDEGTILAIAKKLQDATDFHLKHPPGFIK